VNAPPSDDPPFSWRAILEIVQALALAVIISVVLNLFVVQVTEVRQRSMETTLLQNDRVLVSKVDYRFVSPQPGDIVVFNPTIDTQIPYVKRIVAVAGEDLDLLALVKPQFELGPERVGRGGVVRDAEARRDALRAVAASASEAGLVVRGFASSGLPGPKGNLETFIWCSRTGERVDVEAAIAEVEP